MGNRGIIGCLGNKNFCKDDEEINDYNISNVTHLNDKGIKVIPREEMSDKYIVIENWDDGYLIVKEV